MAKYRLGVRDEEIWSGIFWYDYEDYEAARHAWRLLRDYGRDGIRAGIQELDRDSGEWVTVLGASFLNEPAQ
jgi:hypothetical protein